MSLLRATSFRAAMAYTAALTVAVALVLGLLYNRLEQRLLDMQDAVIWREAANLSRVYEQEGTQSLAALVSIKADLNQGFVLRLSNALGVYLAGNLAPFPSPENTQAAQDGWFYVTTPQTQIRARLLRLDNDLVVLLGQDMHDTQNLLATMVRLFALALLGLMIFGLAGGALLARRNLARVAKLNQELQPVSQGQFASRVSIDASGDEWTLMAGHINTMLARIESLMADTKQVSDNLAHDLRKPLTRLKARLEALLEQSEDAARDQLADALEDVDGLLHSFAALLALSRLESGAAKLTRQPIDGAELLTNLHDLFEAVFVDKQMRLVLDVTPVSGFEGDEPLLVQAVANLLENALAHASVPDSQVVLALHEAEGDILISLTDGGAGIPADKYTDVQKRFVRLEESRTSDGNGLGLSLVAAICRHHGGALELGVGTLTLDDGASGLKAVLRLPKRA
jgi:signal transduction histidine kinase